MLPHAQTEVKSTLGFQFIALPVELLRRNDLSDGAKILASVVMDSARGARSGSCRLSNASLAARTGRSIPTVKRHLAELESAGIIRRDTLAEGRVRTAVVPTWVAQSCTTEQASATQERSTGGSEMIQGVDRDRPTIQTPPSDPSFQTGEVLEVSGGEDPKPTPAEVAAAMRQMIAGRFGAALFAQPVPEPDGPEVPTSPTPKPPTPPTPNPTPTPPKLDAKCLFRQVGYSARAAIVQSAPVRKSVQQQLAELAEWSRKRAATPCPAPAPGTNEGRNPQIGSAGLSS